MPSYATGMVFAVEFLRALFYHRDFGHTSAVVHHGLLAFGHPDVVAFGHRFDPWRQVTQGRRMDDAVTGRLTGMKLSTRASLCSGHISPTHFGGVYFGFVVLWFAGCAFCLFAGIQARRIELIGIIHRTAQVPIELARGLIMDRHEFVLARTIRALRWKSYPKSR